MKSRIAPEPAVRRARVGVFGVFGLCGLTVAEATSLRVALMLPVALALGIMVLGPRALRTAR